MGKSSSQVVGYRYYAKFAAFIGNRIEKLLAINFDNRKWVIHDPLKHPPNLLPVLEGNLFGENEGGVSGNIDIHFGYPDPEPNTEYQKYFTLVSGYPYQSYLLFRGLTTTNPLTGKQTTAPGFYLGNSGYMKEMLLWVKRTRVRNDGRQQWYERRDDGAIVCEIGAYYTKTLHGGEIKYNLPVDASKTIHAGGIANVITQTHSYAEHDANFFSDDAVTGLMSMDKIGFIERGVEIRLNIDYKYYGFSKVYITASYLAAQEHVTIVDDNGLMSISKISATVDNDGIKTDTYEAVYDLEKTSKIHAKVMCSGEGVWRETGTATIAQLSLLAEKPVLTYMFVNKKDWLDINPIHKIREILTDDTAMGKPESDVVDLNFKKAADRVWDEGLGISWAIDEKSCIEAIEELCHHIEAGIRVNRQTGLYEVILFRDDWFAEDEIHDIAENKIKDLSLEVMNSDDIVNQLNVTYYDRQRIKNSTFSVYENGSILTMGHANAESVEFPYFMNMRNAEIVANWKLKQFSTPAWSGSFTTGWREARKWNRYDLIRLPWSKKWNGTILVRIMKINLGNGTDNTVTIDFEEVIPYSGEMNTSIVVDVPVDTAPQLPQPSINAAFEAPYYLTVLKSGQTSVDAELSTNPDIGYVVAIAANPQNNSLNALLYTDGGVGEFEQVSRLDYCDILQLDQPIIETTSSFTVTGSLTQTANSNNLILLNDEFMGFVSFDDETKVLTVKRGVKDTIPRKHSSGTLFVFDAPDIAVDSTQYALSEIVNAKVLTTTPSGILDISEAENHEINIQARAIRPYPPANVKLNGDYFPETMLVASDLTITWVDRNRKQQTGGEPLSWFENGVTIESGASYSIELSTVDSVLLSVDSITANEYIIPEATIIPNKAHKLKLWSVRDNYESYQIFEHNFFAEAASLILTANATESSVSGNTVPTASINVNVDTSLKANMYFDGSSIRGKADAGTTITIEIED